MKTYQGRKTEDSVELKSGGDTWKYESVRDSIARMRSAVKGMTEEKSLRIRDFGGLLRQIGSANITLDLDETLL